MYWYACREVSRDREREKKRDQEDEEEAYERRKLERKLRDKEAAYQEVRNVGRTLLCISRRTKTALYVTFRSCVSSLNSTGVAMAHVTGTQVYLTAYLIQLLPQRLKNWELRERKKARDYAKDSEREDERRREMVRGQESDLTLQGV